MALTENNDYATTDITTIKGLGPSYTKSFYKKGFFNLFDLLLNFPFKYLDQTKLVKIDKIIPDGRYCLVDAHISSVHNILKGRKSILKVQVMDDTASLDLVFFNLYSNQIQPYQAGRRVLIFGSAKINDYTRRVTITQPTVTFLDEQDEIQTQDRLTPVYHAVEKVPQATIRKTINSILQNLKAIPIAEILPKRNNPFNLDFSHALDLIHYPYPPTETKGNLPFILEKSSAFKRICFEELIAYQLTLFFIKRKNDQHASISLKKNDLVINEFVKSLPFELTNAQKRCFEQISLDLSKNSPMLRLLHGDVGSGKTMVAILACLQAVYANTQCVILAPTELLAQQHYQKICQYLGKFNLGIDLLTSSVKGKARSELLEKIANGKAQIIVGTHSLFQSEVIYKCLALAIIDEQHRFGIDQRVALLRKAPPKISLHQLAMTATPIPRTLQLALFSDLDVSTLDELPKNRKPIVTAVMSEDQKGAIINRLKEVCAKGTQVYWVCPNIDENEDDVANVKETFNLLKKSLPKLNIGLLHGQLSSNEKNTIMQDFLDKKYHILVATTIIEVGVDVPNASIIIIEGADKLGLAQLHQLRGRVGRGSKESYCILVYKHGINKVNEIAMQRLNIMKQTNDGFKIATEDLKLRGPGEVFGQKQSGFSAFRIVDVNRDFELIESARQAALDIINHDIDAAHNLIARWYPDFKV